MGTSGRLMVVLMLLLGGSLASAEDVDLAAVHRIKAQAFEDSKVMDHLFWLTDANGPRLTGSPGFRTAADWAVRSLKEWGAANAGLEKWGTFGRGWSASRFSAHMLEPAYAHLSGVPKAWTAGTSGPVTGEVVYAPLFTKEEPPSPWEIEKLSTRIRSYAAEHKGKLRGKVVLFDTARELELPKEAAGRRLEPDRLASVAEAPELGPPVAYEWPITRLPADAKQRARLMASLPLEVMADLWERPERLRDALNAFLRDEGVLAVLTTDGRGEGAIVFAENAGSWRPGSPTPPPVIVLAPEPYTRLVRLVDKKIPVKVEVELQARFHEDSLEGINVVAEIPGGSKKDEVVMLGAHLDSWHGGTGATDHLSFDAVGLPGFQFIQDPLDYGTRTHHSNVDVADHVLAGDLMQASAVLASFVYNAATRPAMLPRKPLPSPLPPKQAQPAGSRD